MDDRALAVDLSAWSSMMSRFSPRPCPHLGASSVDTPHGSRDRSEPSSGASSVDDPSPGSERAVDVDALILDALAPGSWSKTGESPALATFSPGELLARRYVIERFIGRGGMGEVYVARDRVLERRVAIKTVLSTLADDLRAVRRLLREVRLAQRVHHPNVCCVHELGVHADDPRDIVHFMVMDFIDGPSLKAWRRETRPTLARALDVARQILLGLGAMHAAGMVHGDLKPDNVMLAGSEPLRAVLVDFGLTQRLDENQRTRRTGKSGSLGYMAPEQAEGRDLSPRTDIFAFGVVLFELLTGQLPFEQVVPRASAGPGARPRDGTGWSAPAPSSLRPDLPRALDELVLRCLSYAPEQRFASAGELLEALARVGASH